MIKIIKHPGTILGEKQYKRIATSPCCGVKFINKCKEWKGCSCIRDVNIGPYGAGVGHKEFTGDSTMCYRFTLLWLSGYGEEWAKKASSIIKTWSTGCETFKGTNAPLETAWGICSLVRAAEILKYKWNDEWKKENVEYAFIKWIDNVMIPNLLTRYQEIKKWKNNWILTILEALMQIYIFKGDVEKLNWALQEYTTIRKTMWVGDTGKNNECERDIVHATFQLHSHLQICEMARHQGANVYEDMILKSSEYIASIINGKCPIDIKKEAIKDPWYVPGAWEIGLEYFVRLNGKQMPETTVMLNKKGRCPEDASFNWGPGWPHGIDMVDK